MSAQRPPASVVAELSPSELIGFVDFETRIVRKALDAIFAEREIDWNDFQRLVRSEQLLQAAADIVHDDAWRARWRLSPTRAAA